MNSQKPPRPTVRNLICEGLHYCCPWVFFEWFRKVPQATICERLGVQERAVRRLKNDPATVCEKKKGCLASKLGLCLQAAASHPAQSQAPKTPGPR